MNQDQDIKSQNAESAESVDDCPRCGEHLMSIRCKIQCPRCGYTEDCSDAGLIDFERRFSHPRRGPHKTAESKTQ